MKIINEDKIEYIFDELELGKDIFEFKSPLEGVLLGLLRNNSFNEPFVSVLKYLIHCTDLTPNEIVKVIGRFMIIRINNSIYASNPDRVEIISTYLNELKVKGLTTEELLKDSPGDKIIDCLYNDIEMIKSEDKFYDRYLALKDSCQKDEENAKEEVKNLKAINGLIMTNFKFFQKAVSIADFEQNKNKRRFDLLTATAINDPNCYSFKISFDKDNWYAFRNNVFADKRDGITNERRQATLFAFYVKHMLIDNNYLGKHAEYFPIKSSRVKLESMDKEATVGGVLTFIEGAKQNKNGGDFYSAPIVNIKSIVPFNFYLNNELYNFSSEGFKKI